MSDARPFVAREVENRVNQDEVELTAPLHCLGGEAVRAEVKKDLRRLGLLPAEALERLYEALGPLLGGETNNERLNQVIGQFCERYRADRDDVMRGIAASRMLLRGAAENNLDVEKFVEDLETLEVDVLAARSLCSGYPRAMAMIRGEYMMVTLMDHGDVLTRVDWKIDQLRRSNRGKELDVPVVTLTLNYQHGDEKQRLSLQALPPVLRQLKQILNDLVLDEPDESGREP